MSYLTVNEGRTNIQRQSKTQQSHRASMSSQPSNINHHLNRVMKLIEQREQVEESETRNPRETQGSHVSRNASTVMREGAGTVADRSSVKRSITSMSCEETKNKNAVSVKQEAAEELGKLRIVKSIHTRILHSSAKKEHDSIKGQEDDDDSGILHGTDHGTSGHQSQILTPNIHYQQPQSDLLQQQLFQHPLGFFKQGHQQKHSFMNNTNDFVLQGKVKPKAQRSSVARRGGYQPKKIRSRENSCQTTPPRETEDETEVPQVQNQKKDEEIDLTEIVSTQKASSSRSPPMYDIAIVGKKNSNIKVTTTQKEPPTQKSSYNYVQSPKQQARATNMTPSRSATQTSHQQQQRIVKMSLLRQDQAKAGQFLMTQSSQQPEAMSVGFNEEGAMVELSTQGNHKSTAFNSATGSRSSHPAMIKNMHTALRMNKRTNRQRTTRMQMAEADRKKQIFASEEALGVTQSGQFLSSRVNSQQTYQREVKVPKHIRGAFQDHDTSKAFFDKEMNRSRMRQDYMNKTQPFFPSASHKDKKGGKKADLVQIEDVVVNKQHRAGKKSLQHQQFKFNIRPSDDQPALQQALFCDDLLLGGSSDAKSSGESMKQEQFYGDSVLIKNMESEEGAAEFMQEQSQFNYFSTSMQQATRKQSQQPNMGMLQLEQQQKSLYSSMAGMRLPSKLARGQGEQRCSTHAGQRSSFHHMKNSQCTTAQGTLDQAKPAIEKRLLNQIEGVMEKNEQEVYQKHGMVDQIIFSDKETRLYDLIAHPEWSDLTTEMHKVYLTTLEEFNTQLIGQNYFIRDNQVKTNSTASMMNASRPSVVSNTSKMAPAPNRTPKTSFLTRWVKRLRNLLNQHSFLLLQSKQKLSDLVADNKLLKDEVSQLRSEKLIVHDAQHVINELVNQFFAMGNDKNLKANRLTEAEKYLQSETMQQMIEKEGPNLTARLDYSDTVKSLQEIMMHMSQPTVLNKGNQFEISQHTFDPFFTDKIRNLFSSRIAEAQYDSAYRSLKMVCKDFNTAEIGIQANSDDIDHDIKKELQFYKQETARLQAEMNQQKLKLLQNEKTTKTAAKNANDAMVGTAVLSQQIQDLRVNNERLKNETILAKKQYLKASAEGQTLHEILAKLQVTLERTQKFGQQCEKLFDKIMKIDGMKEMLIKEQDSLLNHIAPNAGKDILKKFKQIQKFQQKVEAKNKDLKKFVAEYRASQFEASNTVVTAPASKSNKYRAQLAVEPESQRRPVAKQKTSKLQLTTDQQRAQSRADSRSSASHSNSPNSKNGKKATSFETVASLNPNGDKFASKSKSPGAKKGRKGAKKGAKKGLKQQSSTSPDQRTSSEVKLGGVPGLAKTTKINMSKQSSEMPGMDMLISNSDASDNADSAYDGNGPSELKKDSFGSCFDSDSDDEPASVQEGKPKRSKSGRSISISIQEVKGGRDGAGLSLLQSKMASNDVNSGGCNTKRFSAAVNDYAPMTPITSNIRDNIIINRNFAENIQKPIMQDMSMQTDTELFFKYIFDFLGELERRIENGSINVEDILRLGGARCFSDDNGLQSNNLPAAESSDSQTAKPYDQFPTISQRHSDDATKRKITFSVQELKECLKRLQGLRAYGGDIFFAGIARTMVANPFIPQAFKIGLSVSNQATQQEEPSKALLDSQKKRLNAMTRINTSVAGGGGPVRDSPPSKAYRAASRQSRQGESPF